MTILELTRRRWLQYQRNVEIIFLLDTVMSNTNSINCRNPGHEDLDV